MIHVDKVKLMDSGTVLFRAASQEEAVAKVVQALQGAELEEYAPGAFLADSPTHSSTASSAPSWSPCRRKADTRPASRKATAADASSGPSPPAGPGAGWTGLRKIVCNQKIITIFAVPIHRNRSCHFSSVGRAAHS